MRRLLSALLLATACHAQSDCIPQSTKDYFRKTPASAATRRWMASGDAGGKFVAVAVDDAIWSTLTEFNAQTGAPLWTKPLLGKTNQISMSADGRWIAVALNTTYCAAPKIQLWNANDATMQPKLPGWVNQQGYSVAFSPDSKLLAGSVNGQLLVWDVESAKALAQIEPPGFQDAKGIQRIRDLHFDSKLPNVTGSNGTVRYTWNWKTGKLLSSAKQRTEGELSDTSPKMLSTWNTMNGGSMQVTGPDGAPASTPLQLVLTGGKTLLIPAR
jgi:WD40 repeat protein